MTNGSHITAEVVAPIDSFNVSVPAASMWLNTTDSQFTSSSVINLNMGLTVANQVLQCQYPVEPRHLQNRTARVVIAPYILYRLSRRMRDKAEGSLVLLDNQNTGREPLYGLLLSHDVVGT